MNKKIIKILGSALCCFGVSSSFAFITTSCKNSSGALPIECYDIQNCEIKGFSRKFLNNPSAYKKYDTLQIPSSVTKVASYSFSSEQSSVAPFIKKIDFSKCESLESIGTNCFAKFELDEINFGMIHCGLSATGFSNTTYKKIIVDENNKKYGLATNLGNESQVLVEKQNNSCLWSKDNPIVLNFTTGKIVLPLDCTELSTYELSFSATSITSLEITNATFNKLCFNTFLKLSKFRDNYLR